MLVTGCRYAKGDHIDAAAGKNDQTADSKAPAWDSRQKEIDP